MPTEVYSSAEVDLLNGSTATALADLQSRVTALEGGSPPPPPPPPGGLSSRLMHLEDFGITEDTSATGIAANNAAIDAALIAARQGSRRLAFPPGELRVSKAFNCSGVDISGTQAHLGSRLIQTAPNTDLIDFTGRDHNGEFCTRGGIKDMLLMNASTGGIAINAKGDATYQPDHLRIERVRITNIGGGVGSWFIGVVVNGLDRSSGTIGNRGLHMEEVLIFAVTGNYAVIRGVNDAQLIGIRCYVPLSAAPAFFLGGSAAVPNENIYGYACEAPVAYKEWNKNGRVFGSFATITDGGNNTNFLMTA